VRAEWLHKELQRRSDTYTESHDVYVYAATWNVNGKKPSEALHTWLCDYNWDTGDAATPGR
jgi:hypothetical protein